MNRLEYVAVKALHKHRGDASEATLARNKNEARQMARQLHAGGYKLTELTQLRGKSIGFLLDVWQGRRPDPTTGRVRELSRGTQAIRLSTLRKLCKHGGKPGLVPKENKRAGLEPRERAPVENVAWRLPENLDKVKGANVSLVLRLQQNFGLRKKEGFLLDARKADKGSYLWLDKGTKNGKPREVPIRTEAQRRLLEDVKAANNKTPQGTLVAGASLKGAFDSYKHGMRVAGFSHGHGLRHGYAQERYHELVKIADPEGKGWLCPKAGGLATSELSEDDRAIDNAARETLAAELGHGRTAVVAVYIGKEKGDE